MFHRNHLHILYTINQAAFDHRTIINIQQRGSVLQYVTENKQQNGDEMKRLSTETTLLLANTKSSQSSFRAVSYNFTSVWIYSSRQRTFLCQH